jgi:multidrug resistance efflux pump
MRSKALGYLVVGTLTASAGLYLLKERGGLTGSSVPAYAEAIEHSIAPVVSARIVNVPVHLGSVVKAGDVLVSLDDRAVRLELSHLQRQVAQMEAELGAQSAIAKGQVIDNLVRSTNALADEQAARAELGTLKAEFERTERLWQDKLIDAATFTNAQRNFGAAQAKVQVFERRRVTAPDLYAGKNDRLDSMTDTRAAPFREAIKVKQAEMAQLEFSLEHYQLKAPVDGVVSLIVHHQGDVIGTGVEILKVVRSRHGYLTATVPEERAATLKPGLELTVRASRGLWSEKRIGKVVEVGPSVEQLPLRSWLSPQWPRWGRRATIAVEGENAWKAGERLYVQF